jgi:hypothetical protein
MHLKVLLDSATESGGTHSSGLRFPCSPERTTKLKGRLGSPSRLLGNPGGGVLQPQSGSAMADAGRADRSMLCPRCKNASMDELLRIAPTAKGQGLIALECSSCGYVTSVLVAPDGRRSG